MLCSVVFCYVYIDFWSSMGQWARCLGGGIHWPVVSYRAKGGCPPWRPPSQCRLSVWCRPVSVAVIPCGAGGGRVGGGRGGHDGWGRGGSGRAEIQPLLGLSLPLLLLCSLLAILFCITCDKLIPWLHRLPQMWRDPLGLCEAPELVPRDWGTVLIGLYKGQEGAVLGRSVLFARPTLTKAYAQTIAWCEEKRWSQRNNTSQTHQGSQRFWASKSSLLVGRSKSPYLWSRVAWTLNCFMIGTLSKSGASLWCRNLIGYMMELMWLETVAELQSLFSWGEKKNNINWLKQQTTFANFAFQLNSI